MMDESLRRWDAAQGGTWNQSADEYARFSDGITFYASTVAALLEWIPESTRALLDFGCGAGRLASSVISRETEFPRLESLLLADTSPRMLEIARDAVAASRVRHVDVDFMQVDERLQGMNATFDVIGLNSAMHLVDPEVLLTAALPRLRSGGAIVFNIPDQDFRFTDGWDSPFGAAASRVLPPSPRSRFAPGWSIERMEDLASRHGYTLEHDIREFEVTWDDFIRFYSIPFMGARRLPELTQEERLRHLESLPRQWELVPYRWVFVRYRR